MEHAGRMIQPTNVDDQALFNAPMNSPNRLSHETCELKGDVQDNLSNIFLLQS